tara:strand:- start:2430 stop:2783 length:354 start_codon:yes stop_codon:yes gene_type:complete
MRYTDNNIPESNDEGELNPAISHPEFGVIKNGKDVYKLRKQLEKAPANIQTSAAFMLLRDTNWPVMLAKFVAEVVEKDEKAKYTKKLDRIMNFVTNALYSSVLEEARSVSSDQYRNN